MRNWRLGLTFFAALVLLGACARDAEAPAGPVVEPVEVGLFGDADFDAATLVTPGSVGELVGVELGELGGLLEFAGSELVGADEGDGVGASATLPGAVGVVALVRFTPDTDSTTKTPTRRTGAPVECNPRVGEVT